MVVTEAEIHDFMHGKVQTIKKLTGGVVFTDSIPRNPVCRISLLSRLRTYMGYVPLFPMHKASTMHAA